MKRTTTPKRTVCLKLSPSQFQFVLKHDLMMKAGFKPSPTRAFNVILAKIGYKEPKIPKLPIKKKTVTKKRKVSRA